MKDILQKSDAYEYIVSKIPNKVTRLAQVANSDLYHGPLNPDFIREEYGRWYPDWDFSGALGIISDWVDDYDFPDYLDEDGYQITRDDAEELGVPYYEISRKQWAEALFGKCVEYF